MRLRPDPGPGIEDLHRLRAGIDLGDEVVAGRGHQQVDEALEIRRPGAVGPALAGGEVPAGAAFQHVAGHRPGRAGEADQRGLRRQFAAQAADGLVDRRQGRVQPLAAQAVDITAAFQRFQARADALLEPDLLAQGVGHHQDVGEQDRRIEAVAPDRLQGDLDGHIRREAELEETLRPGPQLAVFRQVAAGLAHQPDWRAGQALASERPQQRLVGGGRRGFSGRSGHRGLGHRGWFRSAFSGRFVGLQGRQDGRFVPPSKAFFLKKVLFKSFGSCS